MQFYWVYDRSTQNHFVIYWRLGSENLGDYHTKHHSAAHHKHMQQYYLHQIEGLAQYAMCESPRGLQECVESDRDMPCRLITQRENQRHNPLGVVKVVAVDVVLVEVDMDEVITAELALVKGIAVEAADVVVVKALFFLEQVEAVWSLLH
eukprot:15346022-Ditylum_brightwellii.AAC.1